MARLIVVRLIQLPLILGVIFMITFWLAWVMPGDPLRATDRKPPPAEVQAAMKKQYNLDSRTAFLGSYLKGLTQGSLGPSLHYRDQSVNDIIRSGFPVSASIGAASLVIAIHLGLIAGVAGALWARRSVMAQTVDVASLGAALLGVSLPSFVIGAVMLVLFAYLPTVVFERQFFPVGGWGTPRHIVLPAVTLAALPAAYIARLIRLGLADVLSSDYIRTAKAKGLSHQQALFRHAMKVAFLPVLSFMGPAAAAAMTGSFVVEKVFAVPGLGDHLVNAVLNKDQFLILGLVLTYSTLLILFNLVVDVAYAWVDPRIELT